MTFALFSRKSRPKPDSGSPIAVFGNNLGMVLIADRYLLAERIGAGGAATVFRAHDQRLHRDVAVKMMSPALASDPVALERFSREARRAANVFHPNLLVVHDFGVDDANAPYIVMELGDGPNLHEVISTTGPVDPAVASRIVASVCDALQAIHDGGLIHRDVKPANLIIGSSVKLADFGIAEDIEDAGALTKTGFIAGTPTYVAPERARGEPTTTAVDIYAAGCVLFEALIGRAPFVEQDVVAMTLAHANQPPPLPSTINPLIPVAFDGIVTKAMAKNPRDRFASAHEMSQALRDAIGGTSPAASIVAGAATIAATPFVASHGESAVIAAQTTSDATQTAIPAQTIVAPLQKAPPPRTKAAEIFRWAAIGLASLAALWVVVFVLGLLFGATSSDTLTTPSPAPSVRGVNPRTSATPEPSPEPTSKDEEHGKDDDKKTPRPPRFPDLPGINVGR